MKKKYKYMLENAGRIQYLENLITSYDGSWDFQLDYYPEENEYYLLYANDDGRWTLHQLEEWEFKFLLKGRKLRSGLSTPMARYYGWKAINK